jgi:phosphoribosyl-ATP pyrophosphohydrolase
MGANKDFHSVYTDMSLTGKHLAVLGHYGGDKQVEKAKEELKELLEVLEFKKDFNKADYRQFLLEEGADVMNMLFQLYIDACIDWYDVIAMMHEKMNRTLKRIADDNGGVLETKI